MSTRLALNPAPESETEQLRRRIDDLEEELREAQQELKAAKNQSAAERRALGKLRHALQPWKQLMNTIFGELDAAQIQGQESQGSGLSPKWEMLKTRLGGRQAEFIDLLQHGEMTAAQLRAAAHCDIRTAYKTVEKMQAAGLLNKNGGKWSLKEL